MLFMLDRPFVTLIPTIEDSIMASLRGFSATVRRLKATAAGPPHQTPHPPHPADHVDWRHPATIFWAFFFYCVLEEKFRGLLILDSCSADNRAEPLGVRSSYRIMVSLTLFRPSAGVSISQS